jgi:heme-degrading monooxygenase HmoA
MILEVADVRITAGRQAEFEHAAHHGIQTLIAPSKGFRGYKVQRSVESPERYVLLLEWDTVEDHTVGFRGSAAFAQWRALVSDFFTQQPFTEHFEAIPPRPLADAEPGLMTAAHDGPMDKPIQDFSDCHADILRMLDDLTALARPEASTPQRRERASRVLNVFRNVVAAHHSRMQLPVTSTRRLNRSSTGSWASTVVSRACMPGWSRRCRPWQAAVRPRWIARRSRRWSQTTEPMLDSRRRSSFRWLRPFSDATATTWRRSDWRCTSAMCRTMCDADSDPSKP